jgi:hypothetical protein
MHPQLAMPPPAPSAHIPSSPPPARPTIRRDFLERLARPLLARVLAPYEADLAARGISLASLAASDQDDRRAIRPLHDLLDAPDDPVLLPVADRLASVARVATPGGREALIKLDTAQALPSRLGGEDLAATACLDFPDLFAAVRVGSGSDAIKGFVLYEGTATREPRFEDTHIATTETFLAAWFKSKHRTAFCEILIKRRGPERHFEVTHGKAPKTHAVIDETLATKIVTQVSTERSYAVYYEETSILAVHALEFIKEGIRRSFGHGFAENVDHFAKATSVLDMAPLRDLTTALTPDAGIGVANVELRAIEVTAADGSSTAFTPIKQADVRLTLQKPLLELALAQDGAKVTYVKLAVHLGGARPLLLEINGARSQLDYDRRDPGAERVLLEWLSARGIWQGSKRAALAATA